MYSPGIFSSALVSAGLAGDSVTGSAALLSGALAGGDLGVLGGSAQVAFFPSWSWLVNFSCWQRDRKKKTVRDRKCHRSSVVNVQMKGLFPYRIRGTSEMTLSLTDRTTLCVILCNKQMLYWQVNKVNGHHIIAVNRVAAFYIYV